MEPTSQPLARAGRVGGRWPARLGVVALTVAAALSFLASFFLPWWSFKLYAPQYPGGLTLVISLTGMGGDVKEIDTLNHYIGMAHLADAAPVERRLAGYGVALLAITALALALLIGRRLNAALALPGFAFPAVFLADSFYWLHRFGHALDPRAPIRLAPFTPEMFGNGKIGQFMTFAQPAPGFWLALGALALLALAAYTRRGVCASCGQRDSCALVCRPTLLGAERSSSGSP